MPVPFAPQEKYVGCTCCGLHNHDTEACHKHLMNTVARTSEDMELLQHLGELEAEAALDGIQMCDVPEAVEILARFNLKY